MSERTTMWLAIIVAVACLIGVSNLQHTLPGGTENPVVNALGVIGGLSFLVAILSGRHVVRAWRNRERLPAERESEKVSLEQGIAIGRWILPIAIALLLAMVLVDSPQIRLLGNGESAEAITRTLVFTNMLIVPAALLVVFAPIASALNRSVLMFGFGLILTPVNFFVAGRLLRLARQELRERALVSSRAPDLRSL